MGYCSRPSFSFLKLNTDLYPQSGVNLKMIPFLFCLVFSIDALSTVRTCADVLQSKANDAQRTKDASRRGQWTQNPAPKKPPVVEKGIIPLYKMIATASTLPPGVQRAEYLSQTAELKAAATWSGVEGPAILQAMLPVGAYFISHPLIGAMEPGVVKSSDPGRAVHVRVEMKNAKGQDISTNLVVPQEALRDNLMREPSQRSFVPNDSQAYYLAMHGGGTKGTSEAVKINAMNYLGARRVAVIGIGLPGHAESSRTEVQNAREFLEFLNVFERQFLAPAKIENSALGGHSWGGMIADMYMRYVPRSKDNPFKTAIALSPLVDVKPGGTQIEKLALDAKLDAANADNSNTNPDEGNLGVTLLKAGKTSFYCGAWCDMTGFFTDWTVPADRGAGYMPIRYIWGAHDPLLTDKEGHRRGVVDRFLANPETGLANAKVDIIEGPRRTLQDRDGTSTELPGHLFFDHRSWIRISPNFPAELRKRLLGSEKLNREDLAKLEKLRRDGSPHDKVTLAEMIAREQAEGPYFELEPGVKVSDVKDPEVFVKLRLIFEEMVGAELSAVEKEKPMIGNLVQLWANNLAFRIFAENYEHQIMLPTAENIQLGLKSLEYNKAIAAFTAQGKSVSQESQTAVGLLKAKSLEIAQRFKNERSVVKDPQKKEAYDSLDELIANKNGEITALKVLMSERGQEARAKSGAIHRAQKAIAEFEIRLKSKDFNALIDRRDKAFEIYKQRDLRARELGFAHLLQNFKDGQFSPKVLENLPPKALEEIRKFVKAQAYFMRLKKAVDEKMSVILASENNFEVMVSDQTSAEDQQLIKRLMVGQNKALDDLKRDFAFLENAYKRDSARLATLMEERLKFQKRRAELYGSPLFTIEFLTLRQLMDRATAAEVSNSSGPIAKAIEAAISEWHSLWNTRVIGETEASYY